MPKYVATSSPLDPPWTNVTVIEGELLDCVRNLKGQPGGDIGVHASISAVQALLGAGLVDELRLVIAPTIVGSGRQLLGDVPSIQLELVHSATSPSGQLLVDYRIVGSAPSGIDSAGDSPS